MDLSDPDVSKGLLKRDWPGGDFVREVAFAASLLNAIPGSAEVVRVLEAAGGVGNHPAIVRWLVHVGRLMATTSGDPSSIPIIASEAKQMSRPNAIQAQIDELEDLMDKARAVNDDHKLQSLYTEQQGLYRLLPGGSDPAIGEGGRTL